jgi:MraZ protein
MGESGAPEPIRRSVYIGKVELMFLGQYNHTIDEKGRITFPSRLRELLADGAYITQGFDKNLLVMPSARWNAFSERIMKMNMADPAARKLKRRMFAPAAKIDFDAAGRFIIQPELREYAGMANDVVIVGVGEDIEIWAPELWKEQKTALDDPETTAESFSTLDLSF